MALDIVSGRILKLLCFLRQLKFADLPEHLDIYSNSSSYLWIPTVFNNNRMGNA